MNFNIQRWRQASWVSFGLAVVVWLWLLVVLPVSAFGYSAKSLLSWLHSSWSGSADMGHGPFIPLVSLYVIFFRRKAIADSIGRPDIRGLVWVLLGLLLFWIGVKAEGGRLCMAALIFLAWAIPFAVLGAGVARQLVFPAAYLLLCMPLDSLVVFFSIKLRLLAAAVGVGIANGIGIPTMRIGTGIHSLAEGGFKLDVAEACSGLRSIFAMIALTAAYAFFTQKLLWKKWALFACAVPVAVIGNVVRIVAIVLVAAGFGEKTATGFYHDYSGYVVFLVAILLLVEMGHLISRWTLPVRVVSLVSRFISGNPHREADVSFRKQDAVRLALTPALLLACAVMARLEPEIQPGKLDFLVGSLPTAIGPWKGSPVWHCHNEQCMRMFTEDELTQKGIAPLASVTPPVVPQELGTALGELQARYRCPDCEKGELFAAGLGEKILLPADTRLIRVRYTKDVRKAFTVALIISGNDRNSLHEPESCLSTQGFVARQIGLTRISPDSWPAIPVKRVDLELPSAGGGTASRLTFVYWIFSGDRNTLSRWLWKLWTAWDRIIRHEASRWVMVTVTSEQPVGLKDRPVELLEFSGALVDHIRVTPPR